MLRTIFFDAVGTLIHLPRPVGEHYRDVARRFGAEPDPAALEQAFRAAWRESPARPAGDGPRPDDDKGWWRDLVGRVFHRVLTPGQRRTFDADGYFEAVYARFAEAGVWAAYPEAPGVLAALRARGCRLGLISNFDRRLYPVLDHLGLDGFFEAVVISSEIGADKPDPLIFQTALARLGVAAGEAWHVGDDPRCDGGASALGMRVFHLERPRQTLHDLLAALPDGEVR